MTRFIALPTSQRADAIGVRVLSCMWIATVPALLAGLWAVGHSGHGDAGAHWSRELASGAALWFPRLLLALLISYAWAIAFARSRGRGLDRGWWYAAWLFVLLLPAATPLPLVAVGLSFGLLFGCHAFGGTGRYIVNPALLGAVFLGVAYPAAMDHHWLGAGSGASTWSVFAGGGPEALSAAGIGWRETALGLETATLGAPSAILCLAGLVLLLALALTSWRVPAGALAGMAVIAWFAGDHPWYWQPVVGSFALALAFVASDPTTLPESRAGQWTLGLLFGALTVILRTFNPEHPEGSLQALLLASLAAPLADHWAASRKAAAETR